MAGFYTSAKWIRKKQKILRRDGYLCADCKRYGRKTPATLVHHIQPYEESPELGLEEKNLVSLCDACHNKRHPEKARDRNIPPTLRRKNHLLRNGRGHLFPPRSRVCEKT